MLARAEGPPLLRHLHLHRLPGGEARAGDDRPRRHRAIRFVNAEYPQEWLARRPLEKDGQKQAAWRTDPAQSGKSNCVGDIGSHVENMVRYLTGLEIASLCARLDTFVRGPRPRRQRLDPGELQGRGQGALLVLPDRGRLRQRPPGPGLRLHGLHPVEPGEPELPDRVAAREATHGPLAGPGRLLSARAGLLAHPLGPSRGLLRGLRQHLPDLHRRPGQARRPAGPREARTSTSRASRTACPGVRFIGRCVESSQKGAVWVDF